MDTSVTDEGRLRYGVPLGSKVGILVALKLILVPLEKTKISTSLFSILRRTDGLKSLYF